MRNVLLSNLPVFHIVMMLKFLAAGGPQKKSILCTYFTFLVVCSDLGQEPLLYIRHLQSCWYLLKNLETGLRLTASLYCLFETL